MDDPHSNSHGAPTRGPPEDRLDSWKKIASYLKRDVSTVQRWERREAMPVHRHLHDKLGSVFAFRSELDSWWDSRRKLLAAEGAAEDERLSVPAADKDNTQPAAPAGRSGRLALVAVVTSVVLLAAALLWVEAETDYFWRSPLSGARFTRLPDFGTEQAAAMSRDGKLVSFLADRDGQVDAWVGEVDRGNYRNLTHGAVHELANNPSIRTLGFSADSTLVSMWTRRSDGSLPGDVTILAVPASGGTPRPYLREAAEFEWSHHGNRLVYHTTAPGDPLFVRDSAASADRRVYVALAGIHCHFPLWSPDDTFIYFVRGVPPDDWDIWRIRPSGADLERITQQNARVAFPVMLDRRTLVYLATDPDGSGPWLYGVDVERRRPHRLSSGLESYSSLAGSADGARLLATVANPHTSLWRLAITGTSAADAHAGEPEQIAENGVTPRIGGDSVLYVSSRSGRQGVWTLAHGSTRELWGAAHVRIIGGPAIAPDGRHIAFSVADNDRTLLYAMDHDGSHVRILSDLLALRGHPAWTPDGQSVVVAVVREGEPRLMRIPLNGETPLPLVSEYSIDPVWSPDGQFLLYFGADVGTTFPLRAAAADGRAHPMPSVMLTRGARVAFFRDPHTLVILRGELGHMNLWLIDLQTGTERTLATLPADFVARAFDVSDTGAAIVLDRIQENSDLALIEPAL